MALGKSLMKVLSKPYPPMSGMELRFGRYDLYVKTDNEGNAVVLFIGQRQENGSIKGERYARRLKKDDAGNVIKDHWELKGKAT